MNIFYQSIEAWTENLSINTILMLIMMIFMIIGAADLVTGNRHGYGDKFKEGFSSIGSLAFSMVGVIAAAPVIAQLLRPIITPIYTALGADPSMFATTILACDMGGYPLAMELASNPATGNFAGLILGTMMGPTIVFTIPVALGILSKNDRSYMGAGIMAGFATIPVGCIAGGLVVNLVTDYHMDFSEIFINLVPVVIIAALLILGLWFAPQKMIKGFNVFGNSITVAIVILCVVAVFEQITGIMLPLFDTMATPGASGLTPLDEGLLTCGHIGIVLIGAFPMVEWLTRTFGKSLEKLGSKLGMNKEASAGLIASFAHVITTLSLVKDMNPKGKILSIAFAVSAASVFGAHLGFTAGVNSAMVIPMIVGKLVGGISALAVANLLAQKFTE